MGATAPPKTYIHPPLVGMHGHWIRETAQLFQQIAEDGNDIHSIEVC